MASLQQERTGKFHIVTGARRSELLRSQLSDIDLDGGVVTIREKKRGKGKSSTRRVPISRPLKKILQKWLKEHPGSAFTFCHPDPIPGSHRKTRDDENQLTKDQASHHFRQVLQGSDWEVIKGWHCLRHSFISIASESAERSDASVRTPLRVGGFDAVSSDSGPRI